MEDTIDIYEWHRREISKITEKEPKACLKSVVRSVVCPDPEEISGMHFQHDVEYMEALSRPCYEVFVENIGHIILESDDVSRGLPELSAHHVKSLCEGKTIKVKLPSFAKERGYSNEDGSDFIISPNNFDKVRHYGACEIVEAAEVAASGGRGYPCNPQTLYINIEKVKSMDNKKSKNAEKECQIDRGEKKSEQETRKYRWGAKGKSEAKNNQATIKRSF